MPSCQKGQRGMILLALALALVALMGIGALAVDIGRMYVAKNELQTYVDSAALAATLQLDGTQAGLSRARTTVAANANKWNFATTAFSGASVGFAKTVDGPWESAPSSAAEYRCVRVGASVDVPLTFALIFRTTDSSPPLAMLTVLGGTATVRAKSAAAQERLDTLREGLFPFSPYAHSTVGPHFGLVPGQQYTLRWPANARLNANLCAGDNDQATLDLSNAGGGSERGYIEETSSDMIRATIEGDEQTIVRAVGEPVTMTGGAKQTQVDAMVRRINQDTDTTSETYSQYAAARTGNGRRIVAVPVNTGSPNYTIVQIAAFLLLPPSEYRNGANNPMCAEYIGSYVFGSRNKGVDDAGIFVARLIE